MIKFGTIGFALSILIPGFAFAEEHASEVKAPAPASAQAASKAKPAEAGSAGTKIEAEAPAGETKPAAEAKQPAVKAPFEVARSLDALQDQIVQGNTAAQRALPRVVAQMADRLLAADSDSWKQVKNVRAVVTYTLSGGQARVIRKIIQIGNSPESEKRLLEGSLAYVEGHEGKAAQLLFDIDAKSLPPSVGGHLALVQAMLTSRDNPKKSNEFLDLARILSPGTLVEETALRREVFNLSDGGDLNKFVLLSSQYLRRFKNSLYAPNFKQRFSETVIHLGMTDNPDQFDKVVKAMSELSPDDQLRLYMLISQAAIFNGNAVVARLAAEKAMATAKDGNTDVSRARLFEAAALILTNNYDQGLAKLKEIEVSQMTKHDVELKGAILSMAKQIRQWPEVPDSTDDKEPAANPKAPGRDGTLSASADPVIDLAQKAISDTDQLLLQEHAR